MIDKLEMFIALARERHFGRAAEAVGVTQPTLSSALRQLEDQLGVQLVHRGSRFQGLTPEGERALTAALRIAAETRALKADMRAARGELAGELRIGAIPTALASVADLVAPFAARHPQVRVQILSRASTEIVDGLERLDLDAGVSYLGPAPGRRLEAHFLYRERYSLLVPVQHPLASRRSVRWDELGGLALCLLTRDMQNRRIVDRLLARAGAAAAAQIESNSIIALASHVATGRWATVLPEGLARTFVARGATASVPISDPDGGAEAGGAEVGLLVLARDPHTPLVAALIVEARRLAAEPRPRDGEPTPDA